MKRKEITHGPVRNWIFIGLQWGDETKGAWVYRFSLSHEVFLGIRSAGGSNAGHTVIIDGKVYALHEVPTTVLAGKTAILGSEMAVGVATLPDEIESLRQMGVDTEKIYLSDRASLLMPWHRFEDELREGGTSNLIGSTKKGIGQCYRDDTDRIGLRACELRKTKGEFLRVAKNSFDAAVSRLDRFYNANPKGWAGNFPEMILEKAYDILVGRVIDLPSFMGDVLKEKKGVLIECAQGAMLDLRHGTYPYVTSSHTGVAGALSGSSLSPSEIGTVLGVAKAYTTRVGNGPFPTKMEPEVEAFVREIGKEKGTTTGRDRDCGWLDLVQIKYACDINGVDGILLSKLDLLHQLPELRICLEYETSDGRRINHMPADLSEVRPILNSVESWKSPVNGCRHLWGLPVECRKYLGLIEDFTGRPIVGISVGAEASEYFTCCKNAEQLEMLP